MLYLTCLFVYYHQPGFVAVFGRIKSNKFGGEIEIKLG
jgi:hypothetical protein